jgi:ribosomal protein S18 acetylase RimI-like enzyme
VGVLAVKEEDNALFISSLAVSPDYRRKGIASYTLSFSQALAKSRRRNIVELLVLKRNLPALGLYLKHGFQVEKEKRRSLVLRKALKTS